MPRLFSWGAAALASLLLARAAELTVSGPDTHGWIRLGSTGGSNQVHVLQASADLRTWRDAAVLHGGPIEFSDVTAPTNVTRFLRLVSRPATASDDGKNGIRILEDPFAEPPLPPDFQRPDRLGWVKFAILREDETRVWFQDSRKFAFHYDYARLRLEPFLGMPASQFDQLTLHREDQKAVLGAVILPSNPATPEYGIQFVGQDVWSREDVARWFHRVRAGVLAPPGTRALYVPTFEQEALAATEREWLAAQGIEVASAARWLTSDAVYSEGWAVGRLVFVSGDRIAAAYASGQLRPQDILLTDSVPAEMPYVAGILSLSPATPNSHVAILARGYGVPFVWFADVAEQARLRALDGQEVALRTGYPGGSPHVAALGGQLTDGLREQIANLKRTPPLRYPAKESSGVWTTNVAALTPSATQFVGGKAANYGLLRRTIPESCGEAIALTFDVWDTFLDQPLPGRGTLREAIAAELEGFTDPPDIARLRPRLEAVRSLITRSASFTAEQRSILLGAITNGPFELGRKIRFRSSTNVEDGEDFTGAGLYDSYSGCVLDDLDDDASGPSICDPEEENERGVFRAIQRVYASFYNENAFLERLRRGVKESEVGMAVLVHHSYPDVEEMANGVVVLHASRFGGGQPSFWGEMVTQWGAVPVTNPDSSARPERVSFSAFDGFRSVDLLESSSLVPLGGRVMTWQSDYLELVRLLQAVTRGYGVLFPSKSEFSLDLEFKRLRPGRLEIKQVRPLPRPSGGGLVTPFLFGETTEWCVEEGEFGMPLAKHRLKSRFSATSDPRRLDAAGVSAPLYRDARITFRQDGQWITLSNGPASWTGYHHHVARDEVSDGWQWGEGADRLEFLLRTAVETRVPADTSAWVVPGDFRQTLQVNYATSQPEFSWDGPAQTREDFVLLVRCPGRSTGDLLQTREFTRGASVGVRTEFWWPAPPRGPTAGYTAPNIGFVRTEIRGLTAAPFELRAPEAQTYSPGHHNFSETFVFEPRLDPGVSATALQELAAADIRILLVMAGFEEPQWWAAGADGRLRRLP
ncbi:MAG: hypothetical protein KIT22_04075 [Verrucomicrobiae bacterium]|nr:hypothetical protein [Verrucomicrobiae bacterium]